MTELFDDSVKNAEQSSEVKDGEASWVDKLPNDLKTDEYLKTAKKFKDEGALLKSYIEAQKKIGQKGVLLPGENATDEDKNNFYKQLGRPDAPEGYDLKKPENMSEDLVYDEDRVKWFAEISHKLGLSKAQVQGFFDEHNKVEAAKAEENKKTLEEFKNNSIASLKKEWKSDFSRKMSKVEATVKVFGGREGIELLKATGLNFHPVMVKMLEKIGSRMGEHMLHDGYVETDKPALTLGKLEQMMKDRRYMGNSYEQDPEYIKTIKEGFERLEAEKAAAMA
jgi:hypothetical protein